MRKSVSTSAPDHPDWAQLLVEAVEKPGIISAAYSRFWNYSVGNQILALIQCMVRKIEPGPIHTFNGWIELGRHVKKDEKAITLCKPIRVRRKIARESQRGGNGRHERQVTISGGVVPAADEAVMVTAFTYKPRWFVLSQTEGADYLPTDLPEWSEAHALHNLAIDCIRFQHPDGNCQGLAINRAVAISPIAVLPHKTLFHELAHVVLGHTAEGITLDDHDRTPVNEREVEAECVALICCESLGLGGIPECRGYIQNWLGKKSISERSAQRIFKAADVILKAGYPEDTAAPTDEQP